MKKMASSDSDESEKSKFAKNLFLVVLIGLFLMILPVNFVSAGVGIVLERESLLVDEGEKACLVYGVYNPWPEESIVSIELSEQLKGIIVQQESETKIIPANTASANAIPVNFCFMAPKIYSEDCLVGNYLCKQDCKEEQKTYSGEVLVKSVSSKANVTGGSTTAMAVSAPLSIKVKCSAHSRNFTLVYIIIAVIASIGIAVILFKKYRKSSQ